MNDTRFPTPDNWPDPSLAPIAEQVRPVCEAGKARALALEIVRICLAIFNPGEDRAHARNGLAWLFAGIQALAAWHARAIDIDTGRESERTSRLQRGQSSRPDCTRAAPAPHSRHSRGAFGCEGGPERDRSGHRRARRDGVVRAFP